MYVSWSMPLTIDRLLADCESHPDESRSKFLVPRADVVDTGEVFQVVVEMPGVRREDLVIDLENDTLTLRGKRRPSAENSLILDGRSAECPFERRFTLGRDVDRGKIQARLEDGIVTVTLPRKEEVKPHRIEVQVES
jgi:HSP20 family protein